MISSSFFSALVPGRVSALRLLVGLGLLGLGAPWAVALPGGTPSLQAQAPDRSPPPGEFDVILEGGRIVDGSGNGWFYGDVAIEGDRIARIAPPGLLDEARAGERIDVSGLVVSPGFIDIQSHSRSAFLGSGDGRVVSKVTQGITTEIMGESTTNAPLNADRIDWDAVEDPEVRARLESFSGPRGFDAWLRAMEEHGGSVNMGSFVGGTTLRIYAKGSAMGAPTSPELDTLRAVTRRAMEDGAFGFATALIYPPGNFATTEELVEMARAMAPYGGLYITHLRSEADRLLEAMDEAFRIGEEGGVPVEIYHLKAAGRRNWAKAARAIQKIDSARARGLDVQANMYPYTAGGTGLTACLPPWASANGGLYRNLEDPEARARIREEMTNPSGEWEDLCGQATPDGVLLLGLNQPENRRWVGRRLGEVADALGKPWPEVVMDLILSERQRVGTIYFLMSEENVKLQLAQPWMKFGTDAGGRDPSRAGGLVHPRAYGTFPRILGRYVRDEGVLSLEEGVRKASSAVATRLGLEGRGLLKEGFFADIAVFDPATIVDRATFTEPHRLSQGVHHVFVNGVAVVREGEHTGALPGRVLRGPGYAPEGSGTEE